MNISNRTKNIAAVVSLILSLLCFVASLFINNLSSDLAHVSQKTERILSNRLDKVEDYMKQAMETDHSDFFRVKNAPKDIVIYRYCNDSLQSWVNQFTIVNDNIVNKQIFYNITAMKYSVVSPLSQLEEEYKYISIGPKWYVARAESDGLGCTVVGALEIKNELLSSISLNRHGVNGRFHLSNIYSIIPLTLDNGVPVSYNGRELFNISIGPVPNSYIFASSLIRWAALMFLICAGVLFLWVHRTLSFYIILVALLAVAFGVSYYWGYHLQMRMPLFSPSVYADGSFFFSLGALMLFNLLIFLLIVCTYIMRKTVHRLLVHGAARKTMMWIYTGLTMTIFVALLVYIHLTFRSLILNSNIVLDPLKVASISWHTLLVYFSYGLLVLASMLLIHQLRPYMRKLLKIHYDPSSRLFRLCYSIICAIYFCLINIVVGFQKEQYMVQVWSNKLAVDRDLELELQLRSVESAIASDAMIATLADIEGGDVLVLHRLADNYFNRVSQNYDISIRMCGSQDNDVALMFNRRLAMGAPIAQSSRFVYNYDNKGHNSYLGMFVYNTKSQGLIKLFLELESKSHREDRGYYSIFGRGSLLSLNTIPEVYSYGRFVHGKMVAWKGAYALPMVLTKEQTDHLKSFKKDYYKSDGYIHFVNVVSDDEIIIVSRLPRNIVTVILSFTVLMIFLYFVLSFYRVGPKVKVDPVFKTNSYRNRINLMLSFVLVVSMVVLSLFSVTFVTRKNDSNLKKIMLGRLSTIQSMIESKCKEINNFDVLQTSEFGVILEDISQTTKTDISLYNVRGKVINSTIPEAYDRMMLGTRMDEDAVYNLMYRHCRYYIHKDNFFGKPYYSLYIPIFDDAGKVRAIAGVPYVDKDNFTRDAFIHMATIIVIFFILLVIGLAFSSMVINRMFHPLMEMVHQLKSTSIDNLEKMNYTGNDEVSALVEAYNRMVEKLDESMKLVTQSERDKAWSEMARQVAHEIKNPLTPMKLTIQRVVRLKDRGRADWDQLFADSSRIMLDQIEILTATANQFSDFAKLYTQDPVVFDLDKAIQDQVRLFQNREDVQIVYMGLKDAMISAPEPQLIRVITNLVTNAIQAVTLEGDKVQEPCKGLVMVYLRNSTSDDCYDLIVEDNGPGVSDENLPHLFTPNFTTKSSGTGLGLAICKSILEKCGGTINYQRSAILKGACFTVCLPKLKVKPE